MGYFKIPCFQNRASTRASASVQRFPGYALPPGEYAMNGRD
jgi:hypothetical protein